MEREDDGCDFYGDGDGSMLCGVGVGGGGLVETNGSREHAGVYPGFWTISLFAVDSRFPSGSFPLANTK